MKKQRLFVVLGMHRGGTSAVARSLGVFDVDLGDSLIPADENINAKGYWEDEDINAFNNNLLEELNSSWHDLRPVSRQDIETLRDKGYQDLAIELLLNKIGDAEIWGFKDPRLCKLLPFWQEVFSYCKLEVNYVLVTRNPLSVANSLKKRDGFDQEKCFLLWLEHMVMALKYTNGEKRAFIDFDRLMDKPEKELEYLCKLFGLEINEDELQIYAKEFLDNNLRHTSYEISNLNQKINIHPILGDVAQYMILKLAGNHDHNKRDLNHKLELWLSELEKFLPGIIFTDKSSDKTVIDHSTSANDQQQYINPQFKVIDTDIRLLAFYLPQYHPIPENDHWWGKGFTEWTNTAIAKPLYPGQQIPNIPSDLGYYDLRVAESREEQAEMARDHGIEAFCYWHYWFGNGKRLLERPLNEVISSGKPDFPFCLAWANHTWSGIWHGCPDRVLIEQTYPGIEDITAHFYAMFDAFIDPRYCKIDGRNIFCIYQPTELKEPKLFMERWRELAHKEKIPGFYFIAINDYPWNIPSEDYDACTANPPVAMLTYQGITSMNDEFVRHMPEENPELPDIFSYHEFVKNAFPDEIRRPDYFPCVVPNWDNTPRSGTNGFVLHGSTPDLYGEHLQEAISLVEQRVPDQQVIFVKSWNEWAESNYLEPDLRMGKAYLEKTLEVISKKKEEV